MLYKIGLIYPPLQTAQVANTAHHNNYVRLTTSGRFQGLGLGHHLDQHTLLQRDCLFCFQIQIKAIVTCSFIISTHKIFEGIIPPVCKTACGFLNFKIVKTIKLDVSLFGVTTLTI